MSDELVIQSHRGRYAVAFDDDALARLDADVPSGAHFVVDARVASLYARDLANVLRSSSVLIVEATEGAKSLARFEGYVEHLLARRVRRAHVLFAIGGGIVQDIVCFLASTLLRGLEWRFYPTTLLAQADSCIGSKSSINVGAAKNVLGTFYPPSRIAIGTRVLATLEARDLRSGVGEMLKVHAIEGPASFDRIAADYESLFADPAAMMRAIRRSLEIKKRVIEEDEFDLGPRNVMNYGHSFGHAIESATSFAVPHGIAVTIGMDMANYTAARLGLCDESHYERMRPVLRTNMAGFERAPVPLDAFFAALHKDKKNTDEALRLVLPDRTGRVSLRSCAGDARFRKICEEYLIRGRSG